MGFLKKITRPISRVLDKIVPNEIKPALPFLAAAAPFMAPGIMGTSMLQRALVSGGLNLGAQLAQEGSEGDFSALSLAMASGIGALSAPGTPGVEAGGPGNMYGGTPGTPSAADYFSGKAAGMDPGFAKSGLGALEKSSNYLTGVGETLRTNPFSMEGLKAGLVPIGQGTTDLAVAEARRAQKDYDREMADYEAGIDSENANRAFAIRQSMEAYGFTEQEILDAIEAAGYKAGGRVRLMMGGDPDFSGIKGAVMAVDENMIADRSGDFFRLREEAIQKGDDDKIKEIESDYFREFNTVMPKMAKDGGIMNAKRGLVDEPGGYAGKTLFGDIAEIDIGESIKDSGKSLINMFSPSEIMRVLSEAGEGFKEIYFNLKSDSERENLLKKIMGDSYEEKAKGGRVGAEEGGLMNLGGREMDMRGGGFIPIGKKERADDVPARLSKNEFVMTADAVRAAGGGSVNEGAKRMYETMNKLEARA